MLVANGFKTAAYCELLFEPQCPHDKPCDGGAQVRRCLTNITSGKMYPVQQGDLAFIALDVEDKNDLGNTDAAVKLIMDAVNAIPAPLRPVIYTDRGQWNSITGSSTAFSSNLFCYGSPATCQPLHLRRRLTDGQHQRCWASYTSRTSPWRALVQSILTSSTRLFFSDLS